MLFQLLFAQQKTSEILTALERQDWPEFVIKPAVGQSGNLVTKLKQGEALPDLSAYGEQVWCYSRLFLKWLQMVKPV